MISGFAALLVMGRPVGIFLAFLGAGQQQVAYGDSTQKTSKAILAVFRRPSCTHSCPFQGD